MKLPDLEPITNKPAQCPVCKKALPVRRAVYVTGYTEGTRRLLGYENAYRHTEPFCTLKCALRYARSAYAFRGRNMKLRRHHRGDRHDPDRYR